ncbi:MAG: hypothetical protein WDN26_05805 [Chitinophagaceae bacterium]
MNYYVSIIFNLFIIIPAIIGLVRFKKINTAYYPFVLLIVVGSLTEIISIILAFTIRNNMYSYNIYVLVEILLIIWQLKNWHAFRLKATPFILGGFMILLWMIEIFFISHIATKAPYFRLTAAFAVVLISVNMLNTLIVRERKNILTNSQFLICLGFTIYFTLKILVQSFSFYGLLSNIVFARKVDVIHTIFNAFTNIIYGFAILWMPTKQRFSMPSS